MIITTIGDEIGETLEEQIETLKKVSINHIELRKINNIYLWKYSYEELINIREKLRENDINVIAIDTPIGKKENSFNSEQNDRLLNKYIEIANIFETKYLRIFSDIGFSKGINNLRKSMKNVINKIRKNKLYLLLENEKNTYAESVSLCNEIINDEENAYILYDVENEYSKFNDILNEYRKNQKKIIYLHMRDYNINNGKFVYFGQGTIPIKALLKELKNNKYDGIISLETMLPKYNKKEKKDEIFLKAYQSFIDLYNMEEKKESSIL